MASYNFKPVSNSRYGGGTGGMSKKQKQQTMIALLALLAIGTGFAFFGGKKDDPTEPPDDDEPENPPPGPDDPEECPVGQFRGTDGVCRAFTIIDDFDPPTNPPGNIDDLINVVPQGDHFYAVKYGDIFLGSKTSTTATQGHNICWMLYRRECFEAAKEFGGMDDGDAWAWVNAIPSSMGQAGKVHSILLCSAYNDACFGTWGYCGDKAVQLGTCSKALNRAGPHGRAIQLLKKHPNNLARIKQGKAVARYCTIGSPQNAGDGRSKNTSGQKGYYPALWCPKLDRQRLFASHGAEIDVTPETWEDGSPRSSPPPWVMMDNTVLDFSGTLQLPGSYGCGGSRQEIR
jgi:hypothetical protein